MEAQDAAATYFFKAWEWVENNLRTVIIGVGILAVAAIIIYYYIWHQNELEVAASQALTQVLVSPPPNAGASELPGTYLQIANDFPGTEAGSRALMLAGATFFASDNYTEALNQFQKYLSANPNGPLAATAALGVAASFDAQGDTNAAANAYKRVISGFSNDNAAAAAKFALGRIAEQRGQLTEAEKYYEDVARNNLNSTLGSEAGLRVMQLRSKAPPTTQTSNNLSAPFNLSTKP